MMLQLKFDLKSCQQTIEYFVKEFHLTKKKSSANFQQTTSYKFYMKRILERHYVKLLI